jgi:hypothetical protein
MISSIILFCLLPIIGAALAQTTLGESETTIILITILIVNKS